MTAPCCALRATGDATALITQRFTRPELDNPGIHGQQFDKADIPDTSQPLDDIPYAKLIGKLHFLNAWTRPDLSTSLSLLGRHTHKPYAIHWKALKRVLEYVKNTKSKCLRFSCRDNDPDDHKNLIGYVDADYAACKDNSKSRTGFVFMCCGAPISWHSKLQPIVAQSTCESEYVAANAVARECEWCKQIYNDLLQGHADGNKSSPIVIREDNQACIQLAKNFMVSKKSKHIRVRFHYVRQQQRDGVIDLEYINSKDNPADLFTKVLADPLFTLHRDRMLSTLPRSDEGAHAGQATPAPAAGCGPVSCGVARKHSDYHNAKEHGIATRFCAVRPQWRGGRRYKRTCASCCRNPSIGAAATLRVL